MAIKVKDAATVAQKWKTRAGAAQQDYVNGASSAGNTFEANALASEELYKTAVVDAASKGRYGAGVRGSGARYTKKIQDVGGSRFQTGVTAGQDAMQAGISPVLQAIAGINLPPRQLPGNNAERSNIVAMTLRKLKYGN